MKRYIACILGLMSMLQIEAGNVSNAARQLIRAGRIGFGKKLGYESSGNLAETINFIRKDPSYAHDLAQGHKEYVAEIKAALTKSTDAASTNIEKKIAKELKQKNLELQEKIRAAQEQLEAKTLEFGFKNTELPILEKEYLKYDPITGTVGEANFAHKDILFPQEFSQDHLFSSQFRKKISDKKDEIFGKIIPFIEKHISPETQTRLKQEGKGAYDFAHYLKDATHNKWNEYDVKGWVIRPMTNVMVQSAFLTTIFGKSLVDYIKETVAKSNKDIEKKLEENKKAQEALTATNQQALTKAQKELAALIEKQMEKSNKEALPLERIEEQPKAPQLDPLASSILDLTLALKEHQQEYMRAKMAYEHALTNNATELLQTLRDDMEQAEIDVSATQAQLESLFLDNPAEWQKKESGKKYMRNYDYQDSRYKSWRDSGLNTIQKLKRLPQQVKTWDYSQLNPFNWFKKWKEKRISQKAA